LLALVIVAPRLNGNLQRGQGTPRRFRKMKRAIGVHDLSRLVVEHMPHHGFRAMARTILDEVLSFRPDFIEHQLAHALRDPNGRAYNRTAHLAEHRKMMQAWADYLDKLKSGADGPVCGEICTGRIESLMSKRL
jgi:hypothetical protein